MAKVTKEQLSIWQQAMVVDMRDHCQAENEGLQVNENRRKLAERRQAFIKEIGSNYAEFLAVLGAILSAWTGTKGQKQSFKRSYSKNFHTIHETKALSFKGDTPVIGPYEAPVDKEWSEVIADTMAEHGASEQLITATIKTMAKERDLEAQRREQLQAEIREDLKREKARTIEQLRARQAEIEKELAAIG